VISIVAFLPFVWTAGVSATVGVAAAIAARPPEAANMHRRVIITSPEWLLGRIYVGRLFAI
jgi:hypothetical protein